MATASLYSIEDGKLVDFELSTDENGDILATHEDHVLKFPGDVTKAQLQKLFNAHNKQNDGKVALTEEEIEAGSKAVEDAQKLIDSL